ncbi:MAG: SpoIIE family protein phosphatase [Spirochaetes bacterium]|nr:SpoIIE family protein phosphatase [Spirochaetota bacterium]
MARVGGDFYDYRVSDNAIDIFIADVPGHGMPGAFLAIITKIAFDHERTRGVPSEVLARMNEVALVTKLRDFSRADFIEDDITMVVLDVG